MPKKDELRSSLKPKQSLRKPIPNADEPTPKKKEEKKNVQNIQPIAQEKHRTTLRLRKDVYQAAAIDCVRKSKSLAKYVEELIMKDLGIKK